MIRIVYISHLHPPHGMHLENMGGMQRVSMQLVEHLEQLDGVEILPITLHSKWKYIGVKTILFLLRLSRKLPEIAKTYNADVILFSSMVTAALAPLIRKKTSIPLITINHGQDVTMPVGIYQYFVPKVFKALDGVISVSNATREESIKRGLSSEKGISLPNGFPDEWLSHMIERKKAKKFLCDTFSIPEDHFILITVGRMVKRKGHAWFAKEVLPSIKQKVTWLVIGDGNEWSTLEQTLKTTGQNERAILAGKQSDFVLYNAYSGSDLFIMPNIPVSGDMEGFGIVMLEAGLAGTPSIASDLEGIRDVIMDGVNGYKIKALQANLFAEKINSVLSQDLAELRISTQKYITENFNWEHVAKQYIDYLRQRIQHKKKLNKSKTPNLIELD